VLHKSEVVEICWIFLNTHLHLQGHKTQDMIANSSVSKLRLFKIAFLVLIGFFLVAAMALPGAAAQTSQSQASSRKLKLSVPPEYPELARKMNIQGVARVLLTVTADGRVVGVKELGGNPVLVAALSQAVKKWKYEAADRESEIEVRFEFLQQGH
jgi:TonB family protein